MDHPDPGIDVAGLHKRFGSLAVLRGVDLTARPRRVTGFLGANGAGKSTTLKILLGLCRADAGTARVHGAAYADHPRPTAVVGAVLDSHTADPTMRGVDHLRVYAALGGHPRTRVDALVDELAMTAYATRRIGTWSTGMRQRLAIATALLGDPPVVVLDEPTNGLDPDGISWVRGLLRRLADEGRTVVVSSHVLAEVEPVLDDVTVLRDGRSVGAGALADLLERTGTESLEALYHHLTHPSTDRDAA